MSYSAWGAATFVHILYCDYAADKVYTKIKKNSSFTIY